MVPERVSDRLFIAHRSSRRRMTLQHRMIIIAIAFGLALPWITRICLATVLGWGRVSQYVPDIFEFAGIIVFYLPGVIPFLIPPMFVKNDKGWFAGCCSLFGAGGATVLMHVQLDLAASALAGVGLVVYPFMIVLPSAIVFGFVGLAIEYVRGD